MHLSVNAEATIEEVLALARDSENEIGVIRFSGPTGVGEYRLPDDAVAVDVEAAAVDVMFETAKTTTPPLTELQVNRLIPSTDTQSVVVSLANELAPVTDSVSRVEVIVPVMSSDAVPHISAAVTAASSAQSNAALVEVSVIVADSSLLPAVSAAVGDADVPGDSVTIVVVASEQAPAGTDREESTASSPELPTKRTFQSSAESLSAAVPVNDWESYLPHYVKVEAYNLNRYCPSYDVVVGACRVARVRTAVIDIEHRSGRNGHTVAAWPDEAFGLEFNLNRYRVCGSSQTDWWASQDEWQWATGVNASAEPHLDDNRQLDPCGRNSTMSVGMGSPGRLGFPDAYSNTCAIWPKLTPSSLPLSQFDASWQVATRDCRFTQSPAKSSCMGLQPELPWAYGRKTNPVVNISRQWTLPGCFYMIDQAVAPTRWSHGQYILLNNLISPPYNEQCTSNS